MAGGVAPPNGPPPTAFSEEYRGECREGSRRVKASAAARARLPPARLAARSQETAACRARCVRGKEKKAVIPTGAKWAEGKVRVPISHK